MDKYDILKDIFGFSSFRQGQEQIIDAMLSGRDVLAVMPTGAGKSVCYQIPALLMEGTAIVISPLISLMRDQVAALRQHGVAAAYINSSLSSREIAAVTENAAAGKYRIIYVAPERLLTEQFLRFALSASISVVTVDEAHCVSQWGQDFRPSYIKIAEFIEKLPRRPIIGAFTATATGEVKEDIERLLRLENPFSITTGFNRENLYFGVIYPECKPETLLRILSRHKDESAIIYCSTRKNVEAVHENITGRGFSAVRYHAGLDESERTAAQEDFISDRCRIIVATNAFGMGIDKSNVSLVVHYNMPGSIESYYQEAGRAGRDGSPAECILLYGGNDVRTQLYFIENAKENEELDEATRKAIKARDLRRLKAMTYYCRTGECLRAYLLRYFGERAEDSCDNCSSCKSSADFIDATVDAQKILSCIYRMGQRFGAGMVRDVLRGSRNKRALSYGFNRLSTYGIMRDSSEQYISDVMNALMAQGYIISTDEERPVIRLTRRAGGILSGKEKLFIRGGEKKQPARESRQSEIVNEALFERLKRLRSAVANVQSVPAYIVFSDASLRDMARKLPLTAEEFLEISGVGSAKLQRYGDKFIGCIREYAEENPDLKKPSPQSDPPPKRKKIRDGDDRWLDIQRIKAIPAGSIPVMEEGATLTDFAMHIAEQSASGISAHNICEILASWLILQGYLCTSTDEKGLHREVTARGAVFGLESRDSHPRFLTRYDVVVCGENAQRFLLENLSAIAVEFERMISKDGGKAAE